MNGNCKNDELFFVEQEPDQSHVDLKQVNYKGQDQTSNQPYFCRKTGAHFKFKRIWKKLEILRLLREREDKLVDTAKYEQPAQSLIINNRTPKHKTQKQFETEQSQELQFQNQFTDMMVEQKLWSTVGTNEQHQRTAIKLKPLKVAKLVESLQQSLQPTGIQKMKLSRNMQLPSQSQNLITKNSNEPYRQLNQDLRLSRDKMLIKNPNFSQIKHLPSMSKFNPGKTEQFQSAQSLQETNISEISIKNHLQIQKTKTLILNLQSEQQGKSPSPPKIGFQSQQTGDSFEAYNQESLQLLNQVQSVPKIRTVKLKKQKLFAVEENQSQSQFAVPKFGSSSTIEDVDIITVKSLKSLKQFGSEIPSLQATPINKSVKTGMESYSTQQSPLVQQNSQPFLQGKQLRFKADTNFSSSIGLPPMKPSMHSKIRAKIQIKSSQEKESNFSTKVRGLLNLPPRSQSYGQGSFPTELLPNIFRNSPQVQPHLKNIGNSPSLEQGGTKQKSKIVQSIANIFHKYIFDSQLKK